MALSKILSQWTITPRSVTSKPLHASTTPTMFLPMSCTSPFTVAMRKRPAERPRSARRRASSSLSAGFFALTAAMSPARCSAFSSSMYGVSHATAFFITRADLTTCGRNILPAPKRSPTTLMPSISGPSMTLSGLPYFWRASSVSSSMNLSMPLSSACSRRFSTVASRHERSSSIFLPPCPLKRSASSSKRSVASARRLSNTSSTCSSSSFGISSYTSSMPALTMPMSMPALPA